MSKLKNILITGLATVGDNEIKVQIYFWGKLKLGLLSDNFKFFL